MCPDVVFMAISNRIMENENYIFSNTFKQPLNWLTGISNLSTTIDGISSPLDQLSDKVSCLHKQVNFEHDTRNVEKDPDANSIHNHSRDAVQNCNTRKTELYFESESLVKILESMIIDNYSERALSYVLVRAREV